MLEPMIPEGDLGNRRFKKYERLVKITVIGTLSTFIAWRILAITNSAIDSLDKPVADTSVSTPSDEPDINQADLPLPAHEESELYSVKMDK
ncbi:hypothetical protein HOF56_01975 [Candidatus Peribacteria bacterium]|jgi:hypothetical protein|nr:hypothetical protein [Candidatus Peribacteria bacterium]MBT4021256.1 hypothetical protein [Candidatus Peribacteria bacterium]MBT4240679.1 hypothetical protein [Candidatus Peribacteria bacterium]MBT4474024.1 hypothetical protein [Candidatus Peribacteria bacterium]